MSYEVQSHNSLSSGASCQVRSCLFQLVCNVSFGFINDLDLISMVCSLCSVPVRWHSNYRYSKSLELLAAKKNDSFQHHQNAKLLDRKTRKMMVRQNAKRPQLAESFPGHDKLVYDWFERTNELVPFKSCCFFPSWRHFLCQMIGDTSHRCQ